MEKEFKYDYDNDIKKIKNGMTFVDNYGNTWLKVGKKCVKLIDINTNAKDFSEFSQEDIKVIFKSNGIAMYVVPIINEVEDEGN